MVSPIVLGFYAATAIWLVLKYRYLISTAQNRKAFDWRVAGELLNAVAIGVSVAVAPYLPIIDDTAWCTDIEIPPLSTAAVLVGALGPLFDPGQITPASAVVASGITTAYLGVGSCTGLASIVATTGLLVALVRVAEYRAVYYKAS
ncbi:MAG: hypothetical protein CL678_16665 [Bdellovibrionaceae bacterium]|nr:hypothetical protein [Pseudobdellovibrionaceae bacterium]